MTTKTPEQIADAIVPATEAVIYRKGMVRALVIEAIEADRAQRGELSITLPSGQTITAWIGTSGGDGSALVQIDTADADGNLRVFINDGDDPIYDENPETGEYEDMTPTD